MMIGDAVVKEVADACHHLRKLDLGSTGITSSAVIALSRLAYLKKLNLSNTIIDDRALFALTDVVARKRYEKQQNSSHQREKEEEKEKELTSGDKSPQMHFGLVELNLTEVFLPCAHLPPTFRLSC